MPENKFVENADNVYFESVEDEDGLNLNLESALKSKLAGLVEARHAASESSRDTDESRWITAYHNFRGIYPKNVRFRESERSRVFIKITKTKVLAAFGQLVDVIFGTGKFPIGVTPTILPEGVSEYMHLSNQESPNLETSAATPNSVTDEMTEDLSIGYQGDGKVLRPGATLSSGKGVFEELSDEDANISFEEGPNPIPGIPTISPAKEAARNMEKLIHDQIEESNGSSELRNALFESVLFGTGIVKGPFNFNKTLNRWTETEEGREYTPDYVRVPRLEFVSIWDFFPDPNATSIEECEYIVHRHKLNKSQLRALSKMPYFNKDEIREALMLGPNYEEKDYEHELKDSHQNDDLAMSKFEVLEYWGMMDIDYAKEIGMELPEEIDELDEIQINAWVCNGKVLRAVVNPFSPARLPYNAFPYERNPYSFFGIGVAENMNDSQQIMNGHARMAIDNLALSGSLVFDIDETMLVGGQSMEIYPGKVFRRQSGMPGQSIHGVKFPNTSTENMMMFDKFRQLADEQTGIPSYSHGMTGVQSMTRTASGMSMLLGAASLNIKTVVKNLDDFLLKPLGQSYFQWNMQFFEGDLNIEGDLEIKAMGTNSLMQKEVRSQRLTMFLQTAQNPAIAPFVKMSKLISELAYSLDLDPDEILNNEEEAALAAQIIGMQNNVGQETGEQAGPGGEQPGAMGTPEGATGVPTDVGVTGTGGGNIGTGNVPQAGEGEFSG
tara:strand:- start:795 stop:2966 length:2172 start_codon:yes stop_codon:yes gene_type:complete